MTLSERLEKVASDLDLILPIGEDTKGAGSMTDKPIDPLEELKRRLEGVPMDFSLHRPILDAIAALEAERAKVKKVAAEIRNELEITGMDDFVPESRVCAWLEELDPTAPASKLLPANDMAQSSEPLAPLSRPPDKP